MCLCSSSLTAPPTAPPPPLPSHSQSQQAHLELTVALADPDTSLAELQRVKVAKGVDPVSSDNFVVIVYYELVHSSYVCVCRLARNRFNEQLTADVVATVPVQVGLA